MKINKLYTVLFVTLSNMDYFGSLVRSLISVLAVDSLSMQYSGLKKFQFSKKSFKNGRL